MESFLNIEGVVVVKKIIEVIQENSIYLSELDGKIGDGDHGINMKKGAALCEQRLANRAIDLSGSLKIYGDILLKEIGGAMGPLYGTFFREMAAASKDNDQIDATIFKKMLSASLAGVQNIGNAKVGDKSMIDTLAPALAAYEASLNDNKTFQEALTTLKFAAEKGKQSTIDLVAKVGRASRLGERSRGQLDAGATSCCFILMAIADSITALLNK